MDSAIYLGLGTNLGERSQNLQEAIRLLASCCDVVRCSSIYQTEPWGYADQPDFLNQVIEVETRLSPLELLPALKAIETQIGRQVNFRYGPRLIDIDILLFGNLLLESPSLTIPHAMLEKRAFVLVPLVELAPDLIHPASGILLRDTLHNLDSSGVKLMTTKTEGAS
jgi:2-amino-4-hydroxy-6-hydroxymethyldihydropteridine diphosphokinase